MTPNITLNKISVFSTCSLIFYQSKWVHTQHTMKGDNKSYIVKCRHCPITFCNYKCLNISPFPNSAVFYTFICYQSELISPCWRWSIFPSYNINWFSYCYMVLSQIAFVYVSVVTRDEIDWFPSNLTDLTLNQPILLVSTTTPAPQYTAGRCCQ